MRPETEKRPTARFRAAAPPCLGPRPSSRRPGRRNGPRGAPSWAASGLVGRRPPPDRRIKSDSRAPIPVEQNRRGVAPNPNRPFLLPFPVSYAPASGGDADGGRRQGKVVAPPWLPRRRATLAQRARDRRDGRGWRPCSGSGPCPETTAQRRPATGFLCARRRAMTRAVVLDRER